MIPVQPAVGLPVPLPCKYAISEGAYLATGAQDDNSALVGFRYSPTMGTYVRANFPNSFRLRERSWAYGASVHRLWRGRGSSWDAPSGGSLVTL